VYYKGHLYFYLRCGAGCFFGRFCAHRSCFGMPQTMQAFLCDKAAVIGDTIKDTSTYLLTYSMVQSPF